jgi:hypothetical protein
MSNHLRLSKFTSTIFALNIVCLFTEVSKGKLRVNVRAAIHVNTSQVGTRLHDYSIWASALVHGSVCPGFRAELGCSTLECVTSHYQLRNSPKSSK